MSDYLSHQRWFAGKNRSVRKVSICDCAEWGKVAGCNAEPTKNRYWLCIVQVAFSGSEEHRYILPLSLKSGADADDAQRRHPNSVVCQCHVGSKSGVLVDAFSDPLFRHCLLCIICSGRKVQSWHGTYHSHSTARAEPLLHNLRGKSQLLSADQSNSAAIFGDSAFLKLYRRIGDSPNPDAEISAKLTRHGFPHSPVFLGSLEYCDHTSDGRERVASVALLQEVVSHKGTAWDQFRAAAGRYYERVLSALGVNSKIAGHLNASRAILQTHLRGQFLRHARLLGEVTAELHTSLSEIDSGSESQPEKWTEQSQRGLIHNLRGSWKETLRLLEKKSDEPAVRGLVSAKELTRLDEILIRRLNSSVQKGCAFEKIRIHGDYHLGQVLRTSHGYTLVDFEGEPTRPFAERRLKQCALKDVAGMIRSFDYAAHEVLFNHPSLRERDRTTLRVAATAWSTRATESFLSGYLARTAGASFLIADKMKSDELLRLFVIEKVLYEIRYELAHRPAWVTIPVRGLLSLLSETQHAPVAGPC